MTALEIVDHRRVWHEPNGYLVGDRYLCADCAYWADPNEIHGDDWRPLGVEETDCPDHCEDCEALIYEPLTSDGVAYVREALARGTGRAEVLATWREAYAVYLDDDNDQD